MSSTTERLAGSLVLVALAGAGIYAACGTSQEGSVPEAPARAHARRALAWRGAAAAQDALRGVSAMAYGLEDGGVEALEALDEPPECWTIHVVDAEGRPTAALVLVTADGGEEGPRELQVPPSGEAELCSAPWTDVSIDAWTDDGRWGRTSAWVGGEGDFPREPEGPVEVVVFETATLRGRVQDARGRPIADAVVDVVEYYGDTERCPVGAGTSGLTTGREEWRTDAEGRFELPIGRMGVYLVCATHDDFVTGGSEPLAARPGASFDVAVTLEDAQRFRGVIEHEGAPVEGATVQILSGRLGEIQETADGTFDFGGLAAEESLMVRVWAPGFVSRRWDDLRPGEHHLELERGARVEVTVELPPAFRPCFGPGGAEAGLFALSDSFADVMVEATALGMEPVSVNVSDPAAPAVLEDLPAGPVTIVAWAFGASGSRAVVIDRGATPTRVTVPIDLEPGAGVLRVAVEGAPDQLAILQVGYPGAGFALEYLRPGRPSCRRLDPGHYRLIARAEGRAAEDLDVEVRPGSIVERTLHLTPAPTDPATGDEPPDADGEDAARACTAPLDAFDVGERTFVAGAAPGSGLFPGDELLDEDDPYERLWGPEGTTVAVRARRPDGSVVTVELSRSRCP